MDKHRVKVKLLLLLFCILVTLPKLILSVSSTENNNYVTPSPSKLIKKEPVTTLNIPSDAGGGSCAPSSNFYIQQVSDDCSYHGKCVPDAWTEPPRDQTTLPVTAPGPSPGTYFCVCDDDWAGDDCSQARKSKRTAFYLSLTLGCFGIGRWYLGYVGVGILQFMLGICWCCPGLGILGVMIFAQKKGIVFYVSAGVCMIMMVGFVFGWWLVDWILILRDDLDDGSGIALLIDM